MGELKFAISADDARLPTDRLHEIYTIDPLFVPTAGQAEVQNETCLLVKRPDGTSARVFMPWLSTTYGLVYLATATLPVRHEPYGLHLEVARGTVCRLTLQFQSWREGGLEISPILDELIRSSISTLNDAIFSQGDKSQSCAIRSIETSLLAIDQLVDEFSRQLIDMRMEAESRLPTFFGTIIKSVESDSLPEFELDPFNAVFVAKSKETQEECEDDSEGTVPVSTDWEDTFEWVLNKRIMPCLGPIIRWTDSSCPKFNADFESVRTKVTNEVSMLCERLSSKSRLVYVASGLATRNANFTDLQMLQLTRDAVTSVRSATPDVSVFISFGNPFGESAMQNPDALSPIHAIDTMLRTESGLAGIGLELTFGDEESGLVNRDLLQINELVDNYSQFGLPLIIIARFSTQDVEVEESTSDTVTLDDSSKMNFDAQVRRTIRLLLSKSTVAGIVFAELVDENDSSPKNCGLFNETHTPKKFVRMLTRVRNRYLQ